ncbi:hypothetical protein JMN32_00065 [Fulvivirga sp. 29W222]|uniref:Uncharacterized protein n=1 Tax=Fulvivirga marina TaxID=2494733 RepID=A0A937FUY9_9BACT|nr:hypothetical protein [Fulvivirga marina]MBL6444681.1 hypothetical protein [Fulvivirga marina]
MKTIAALAVGFWLGRQMYINYDRQQALEKEAGMKRKVKMMFEEMGLSKSDITEKVQQIEQYGNNN